MSLHANPRPAIHLALAALFILLIGAAGWRALARGQGSIGSQQTPSVSDRATLEEPESEATPALAPLGLSDSSRGDLAQASESRDTADIPSEEKATDSEVDTAPPPLSTLTLSVLEAGTQSHLDQVQVRLSRDRYTSSLDPKASTNTRLVEGEPSPVEAKIRSPRLRSKSARLLVGAKGYAWSQLTVDLTKDSQRSIELVRAGSLRIRLKGDFPRLARVRVYDGPHAVIDRIAAPKDVSCVGLAPSDYLVRVEFGELYKAPAVLATTRVQVEAGLEAEVWLDVRPLESITRATVRGKLHVPLEWEIMRPDLTVRLESMPKHGSRLEHQLRESDLKPAADSPGTFAFQIDDIEVGTYSITLNQLCFTESFELPPEGLDDLVLHIPRPVNVTVTVEDEDSGEAVPEVSTLVWSPTHPPGLREQTAIPVTADAVTNEFHLRVPASSVSILAAVGPYSSDVLEFSPRDGDRVTYKVRAELAVWVDLRSGMSAVPWPNDVYTKLVDTSGKAVEAVQYAPRGRLSITVDAPGTYLMEVPRIPGFRAHPPVELLIERGPRKSFSIDLVEI